MRTHKPAGYKLPTQVRGQLNSNVNKMQNFKNSKCGT